MQIFQNIEKFIKDVFEDRYKQNIENGRAELLYSFAVSIFAIGGMLGGFSGGIIANRFGRLVKNYGDFFFFFLNVVLRVYYTDSSIEHI